MAEDLGGINLSQVYTLARGFGLSNRLEWDYISLSFSVAKRFSDLVKKGRIYDYRGIEGYIGLAESLGGVNLGYLFNIADAFDIVDALGWVSIPIPYKDCRTLIDRLFEIIDDLNIQMSPVNEEYETFDDFLENVTKKSAEDEGEDSTYNMLETLKSTKYFNYSWKVVVDYIMELYDFDEEITQILNDLTIAESAVFYNTYVGLISQIGALEKLKNIDMLRVADQNIMNFISSEYFSDLQESKRMVQLLIKYLQEKDVELCDSIILAIENVKSRDDLKQILIDITDLIVGTEYSINFDFDLNERLDLSVCKSLLQKNLDQATEVRSSYLETSVLYPESLDIVDSEVLSVLMSNIVEKYKEYRDSYMGIGVKESDRSETQLSQIFGGVTKSISILNTGNLDNIIKVRFDQNGEIRSRGDYRVFVAVREINECLNFIPFKITRKSSNQNITPTDKDIEGWFYTTMNKINT